jgi:GT2 family glycosyltransferase
MAASRVAVVMITHNRCEEVLRSLDHLTALPERPHIVVVDNGSSDGTAAAIGRRFPQVEIVEAGSNRGAAGRNLGLRRITAPYVALCDDDAWWEPGHLERAAELFDRHPRLAIVTARILVGPEAREASVCRELKSSPLPVEDGMPGPPLLGFLAGASVVRRSAFLEVGGFPEHVFIGGEEELVAVDLASRGYWMCYVPELILYHYPSPHRDLLRRRINLVRNAIWFAWMRRPLRSALRQTFQAARDASKDPASRRGFFAAITGLPGILRQRRVVPREVEKGLRLLDRCRREGE